MSAPASPPPLILASGSPRRAAILRLLELDFRIRSVEVPEAPHPDEDPFGFVQRMALLKAEAARKSSPDALVLAGDTVVVREGRILGKPAGREDAERMLLELSGGGHQVATGLALAVPGDGILSRVDRCEVTFRSFDPGTARAYVDTGEPLDKAGAYGIQGRGAALVSAVEGDYYAVVGLSVAGLIELLEEAGWRFAFGRLLPLTSTSER